MAEEDWPPTAEWADLYVKSREEMTGLARNLLFDKGVPASRLEAEDVVHAAFAKAFSQRVTVRNPRAYVYAIIRREIAAVARRHADHEPLAALTELSVPDIADEVAQRVSVWSALEVLAPRQREDVWWTKAKAYTERETADALGKHPGTVATQVSRAMTRLRTSGLLNGVLSVIALVFGVRIVADVASTEACLSAACEPGGSPAASRRVGLLADGHALDVPIAIGLILTAALLLLRKGVPHLRELGLCWLVFWTRLRGGRGRLVLVGSLVTGANVAVLVLSMTLAPEQVVSEPTPPCCWGVR